MTTRPPPSALERRSTRRKVLRQPATLVHRDATMQVHTWDLGTDGLCLLTPRPVSPGSRCQVTFQVPIDGVSRTVTVPVKVVYSSYQGPEGFKIGTVFTDLDEETAGPITDFANSL